MISGRAYFLHDRIWVYACTSHSDGLESWIEKLGQLEVSIMPNCLSQIGSRMFNFFLQHLHRDITKCNQFDISSALASGCSKLFCNLSKKLSYITNQRQARQTKICSKIQIKQVVNWPK
jgi:hypothetical protein